MSTKVITIDTQILKKNDIAAQENRDIFKQHRILAINLLSSPGSGKTSLLVKTCSALKEKLRVAVSVGDLQTEADALRIAGAGVPVVQINTGTACHLDAHMVQLSLKVLPLAATDILFIENVGNLVCPAEFKVGEDMKMMVLSIAEGHDKPLKYPLMFRESSALVLNKMDLLPYMNTDMNKVRNDSLALNPKLKIFEVSCTSGAGIDAWATWLSGFRS